MKLNEVNFRAFFAEEYNRLGVIAEKFSLLIRPSSLDVSIRKSGPHRYIAGRRIRTIRFDSVPTRPHA